MVTVKPPKKLSVKLQQVNSSALSHVGYDPATLTLAVKFNGNNTVHHYGEFSPKKWADMQAAESIGKFHAQHVRNHHPHSVPGDEA